MRLERTLDALARDVLKRALDLDHEPEALLRTADPKFGDYQINGCMALGKRLGKSPRELAGPVAEMLAREEAIAEASVAGPGFVNLRLDPAWVSAQLNETLGDPRLGIEAADAAQKIVVDFSAPNIAKQMHVGHIRSTIIGAALVKILRAVGHTVIADNHLGDWGTQYGLLIVGMRAYGDEEALAKDPIEELERIYKLASARARHHACPACGHTANLGREPKCPACGAAKPDAGWPLTDPEFAASARAELAKLQAGDPENFALWERFVAATRQSLDEIYARLGVTFDEWLGESAYHAMLPGVVQKVLDEGIAREDQGAIAIFFGEQEGEVPPRLRKQKVPFLVRKRDGAFLYATSDIATIDYRKTHFGADRAVYVVDGRQAQHFEQLFAVARLLGHTMELVHVGFGMILGDDGTPLRTRDGGVVTLKALLDEAEEKAAEKIEEGRASGRLRIADEDLEDARRIIGIGAVKYVDLMQNRTTDYRFDYEKMTSFKGNAAPYLQFQYARCRSIFDKGEVTWDGYQAPIQARTDQELALQRELARFGDVVHRAADEYEPHLICDHLYAIAQGYSRFYTECPVLDAEGEVRASRLAITRLTALQLEAGLELLGIQVLERM